jgi:uncharacterized lipoprotein YmbA
MRRAWFLVAALAGCAALKPQADRTQYFLLEPIAAPSRHPVAGFDRSVGVGPIVVPDHLAAALVTRVANNQIAISDTERWGEPLRDGFGTTLRQDLAVLLGSDRVVAFPWEAGAAPDLAVQVELRRFERTGGAVELAARWSVVRGADRTPITVEETRLQRASSGDARAAVGALSATVADLARQIATALQRVPAAAAAK